MKNAEEKDTHRAYISSRKRLPATFKRDTGRSRTGRGNGGMYSCLFSTVHRPHTIGTSYSLVRGRAEANRRMAMRREGRKRYYQKIQKEMHARARGTE